MKLIKEPKSVDFVIKSEPWTEQELVEFRILMKKLKKKNKTAPDKKQKAGRTLVPTS